MTANPPAPAAAVRFGRTHAGVYAATQSPAEQTAAYDMKRQNWTHLSPGDQVAVTRPTGEHYTADVEIKTANSQIIWIRRHGMGTRHLLENHDGTSIDRLEPPEPNPREVVAALPNYVAGRRAVNPETAALASNESHEKPLPSVQRVIREALKSINRYPEMGATALREHLATVLGVPQDAVAVGPGSVGVLQQLLSATCEAGDEVIFAWRSFEAYPILVQLAGASPVPIPLGIDEQHDLDAMLAAITEKTRVIIICTPNNPTGTVVEQDRLERFLAAVPPHVFILIDEAYVEYVDPDKSIDTIKLFQRHVNVCLLRTFSKAYGLAGLRIGYGLAHPILAAALRSVALPFGVSDLAQRAAIASLEATGEIQARAQVVTAERSRLLQRLRDGGWVLPDTQANFIWLRTDETLRTHILKAFDAAEILVRSFSGDGIRISLADARTNDRVLEVLGARDDFE
ncbi:histidinol-phosphate transaminase [Paenarthrobacter sp. YJN-5]|uniref:histidinol-phosphate transaminase n=1 Tax=unclassified Paenarthrobacter TaxID=2634190 RepID=UPI001D0CC7F9|nr:histidinol-phosphate transaminase [Paenarthrobacter sp. YJN-5]